MEFAFFISFLISLLFVNGVFYGHLRFCQSLSFVCLQAP